MIGRPRKVKRGGADGNSRMTTSGRLSEAFAVQLRVIGAILLRDMRTRFGRTHFGYLIAVAWPLAHLTILTAANVLMQRVTPMGTNMTVFVGTGLLPYILCLYPSRMTTSAVTENRPLLLFPIVKSIDLILARTVLSLTIAANVTVAFILIVALAGVDFWPNSPVRAIEGVLATVYLGAAFGMANAVFVTFVPGWTVISILTMILMYLTSGAIMPITRLPQSIQDILAYNPLLHCVDWLRSAYYEGYGSDLLDEVYLLQVATCVLLVALASERFLRGRIIQA